MPRIPIGSVFLIVCALCAVARAQSNDAAQVSEVFAVLSNSVDTKTAARGDEILLTTMNDLTVRGKIVIPKGARLVGHVASVVSRGKEAEKTALAIVIDKAISKGADIPLEAIVAAIAAPRSDPSAKRNSTATVAAQQAEGAQDQSFLLKEGSQGAIGYPGISIAWNLTLPPPSTIFATTAKNFKLVSGTQMLLRMILPQTSN